MALLPWRPALLHRAEVGLTPFWISSASGLRLFWFYDGLFGSGQIPDGIAIQFNIRGLHSEIQ